MTPPVLIDRAERRRVLREMKKRPYGDPDWAYVRCEECGWVGWDVHEDDPAKNPNEWVTPCPECGHEFALFAFDYPAAEFTR